MLTDRIRSVRKTLGLSQREFGEKLGVSRDVISNIEYGRVQPKKLFLQHMCRQCGVNARWLECGEGDMFDVCPESERRSGEALSIFRTLRPEFQDYALEQIRALAELEKRTARS